MITIAWPDTCRDEVTIIGKRYLYLLQLVQICVEESEVVAKNDNLVIFYKEDVLKVNTLEWS